MSDMFRPYIAIMLGAIGLAIGVYFMGVTITAAATQGASASIGSFSNAKSLNDLTPFIGYAGLIITSLIAMIIGGIGIVGRGPLGRR